MQEYLYEQSAEPMYAATAHHLKAKINNLKHSKVLTTSSSGSGNTTIVTVI